MRFTTFSDHATATRVLYVDDVRAGRFGFFNSTVGAYSECRVQGAASTVDEVGITLDQPRMANMPGAIVVR